MASNFLMRQNAWLFKANLRMANQCMANQSESFERWCLLIQIYFCKGYDYGEKVDLSKGYWNPKRKMRVPYF